MVISLPETYSSHPKMAVWKMKFHCGMAYLFSFREGKYSEHMTGFFLGAGVGHCGGVSFHSHRKRIFSSTWYCQSSFTSCSSISNRCLVLPGTQLARPNDVTQNGPWKRWRLLGLQYGHVWVFFYIFLRCMIQSILRTKHRWNHVIFHHLSSAFVFTWRIMLVSGSDHPHVFPPWIGHLWKRSHDHRSFGGSRKAPKFDAKDESVFRGGFRSPQRVGSR